MKHEHDTYKAELFSAGKNFVKIFYTLTLTTDNGCGVQSGSLRDCRTFAIFSREHTYREKLYLI